MANKDIQDLLVAYSSKTISELNFIIINSPKYSSEEVTIAKQVIEEKRMDWEAKNRETVKQIDELICKEMWFHFHVLSFDREKLIIAGNHDLIYYHTLEVIFKDVFFVSGFFEGWHSNTKKSVFQIPENVDELSRKYEIIQDYQLFLFKTEDYHNDIIVIANNVSFNTDTVFYYDRPNLEPNQRIADFVKNKKLMSK